MLVRQVDDNLVRAGRECSAIIATIIDPPATMLNVVGDTVSSMLVTRIVDGKDWLKNK